jgi:Xaa-Pro dipeptidase
MASNAESARRIRAESRREILIRAASIAGAAGVGACAGAARRDPATERGADATEHGAGTTEKNAAADGAARSTAATGASNDPAATEVNGATGAIGAHADDLLLELTDQRASASPIRESERRARRRRLGELLTSSKTADALLMEGGATMTYLTGVSWGHSERFFGLVVTASGEHFWVLPAFEESRARERIDGDERPGGAVIAWQEDEYFAKPLAAELARRGIDRVAIEPALRHVFVEKLAAEIGSARIVSGQATLVALRGIKDAHEIELLRRANELTLRAVRSVARVIRPGMNGAAISALMARAHARLGMQNPWCLALIGPAAALPHGEHEDVGIERGDVLLVDTGASFHGYQSDDTRTWVFEGKPSVEVERAWNAVHDAQQRAFEHVRPGVRCGDVDRAARALIESRGFGGGYTAFTHRLGHGIGLEGHEDPYFDGGNTVSLAPGMTLSNEPGVYLPGRFGVRLEDIVLVTESGADHFGEWQKSPTAPD